MKFDPRIHIGEQHGIYIIEDVLPEDKKDKYGHWVYKFVCKECGHERYSTYGSIKSKPPNECIHVQTIEPKYCLNCGKEIPVGNLKRSEYEERKFCNNSCSALYNNPLKEKKHNYCLNCNTEIPLENKYCSIKCQQEHKQKEWEEKWFAGEVDGNIDSIWTQASDRVRTYLFNKYNNKCSRCGWGEINQYTGNIPLEIEHIDGNPYNTTPENVTLLCPNCHSLTKTYRGANKGHGRNKTWIPKK